MSLRNVLMVVAVVFAAWVLVVALMVTLASVTLF
jgi:hypothetical protein